MMKMALVVRPFVGLLAWSIVSLGASLSAADFSNQATALPIPPDARKLEFTAWTKRVNYTTQSPLKSVAAFYLKEMAARGWEHDASEVEIDDDSIELTFLHGDSKVEVNLSQWSKELRVRLGTKGLEFTDVDNPTKLAAAGIRVPRAALFFQREIQLPASAKDLQYDSDGCMFKSAMKLQEVFDNLSGQVKAKGFRESRRPIVNDTRRYTEFKKGTVEVSVNVFTHEIGSRVVLEYEDQRKEPTIPPLDAVASLPIHNPGESPAELAAVPKVEKTTINVANNKGQAVIRYGGKTYTFSHVACFQTKDRGDYATEVFFASQPIPLNKMQTMVATQGDFSFGDLYEFDFPNYFMIQLGKYHNLSFSADGTGIGGSEIENPSGEMKTDGGRVVGMIKMPAKEILSRPFAFTATIDAAIITPNTKFSTGAADPVQRPSNPILDDSPVPMPEGVDDLSRQGSKFRMAYSAKVAKPLSEVAAFYRQELTAKGLKQTDGNASSEAMAFSNATMELSVSLKQQGAETVIEVVTREVALAKREGIAPESGKGRLVLGNAHTVDVVFSIGKTDYPLKAGRGAKDFKQALNYSIPSGTYNVVIKIPGQPPQTERIELTVDSTWAIIALPTGGYLPMQLY